MFPNCYNNDVTAPRSHRITRHPSPFIPSRSLAKRSVGSRLSRRLGLAPLFPRFSPPRLLRTRDKAHTLCVKLLWGEVRIALIRLDPIHSSIVFLFLNGISRHDFSRHPHTTFQLGIGFESPRLFLLRAHVSILTRSFDPLDQDCSGEPVVTTHILRSVPKDPSGTSNSISTVFLFFHQHSFIWIFPFFTGGGNDSACFGGANDGNTFTFTGVCFSTRRAPSSQSAKIATLIGSDGGPLRISKS
jgi:hypothetical protein